MSFIFRLPWNGLYYALFIPISITSASPVTSSHKNLVSAGPTSITLTPSFVSTIHGNTHISTTGVDGKATSVPVIGGPECWFCPSQEEGTITDETDHLDLKRFLDDSNTEGAWALLGIDRPGTYQPAIASGFLEPIPVITVLDNGDPLYFPTQTTDEPVTNIKRDTIPTKYLPTERFMFLWDHIPHSELRGDRKQWNNKGFAIRMKHMEKRYGLSIPSYYGLLAGFVRYGHTEFTKIDCDGQETLEVEIELDWICGLWRLRFEDETGKIFFRHEREIPNEDFKDLSPADGYKFKYLGRIETGATSKFITTKANEVADAMNEKGGYNYFFNNCRDFTYYLYKRIKFRGKRSLADADLESSDNNSSCPLFL